MIVGRMCRRERCFGKPLFQKTTGREKRACSHFVPSLSSVPHTPRRKKGEKEIRKVRAEHLQNPTLSEELYKELTFFRTN